MGHPQPQGSLEFRSVLEAEEYRPHLALMAPGIQRGDQVVVMCSWYKRIRGLMWMEAEDAIREMDLFKIFPSPKLSHGICPQCEKRLLQVNGDH